MKYFLITCMLITSARLFFAADNARKSSKPSPIPILREQDISNKTGLPLPTNTAVVNLTDGRSCVSLFAGLSGRELQAKSKGKRSGRPVPYYFHGSEVSTFPRPVEVLVSIEATCTRPVPGTSFGLPEFAKHLDFVFHWDLPTSAADGDRASELKPISISKKGSVWKEDSSNWESLFVLPAEGLPIHTSLVVKVSSGQAVAKTFILHL